MFSADKHKTIIKCVKYEATGVALKNITPKVNLILIKLALAVLNDRHKFDNYC